MLIVNPHVLSQPADKFMVKPLLMDYSSGLTISIKFALPGLPYHVIRLSLLKNMVYPLIYIIV